MRGGCIESTHVHFVLPERGEVAAREKKGVRCQRERGGCCQQREGGPQREGDGGSLYSTRAPSGIQTRGRGWDWGIWGTAVRVRPRKLNSLIQTSSQIRPSSLQIRARTKSLFSIMKKLLRLEDLSKGGRQREDIYDVLGMRAVVQPRTDLPQAQVRQFSAMGRAHQLISFSG